ncbi:GDPD-domain-containing protein [Corynespora cassiicola Philippines]|uniref:GDPD-domain-containing protein n=1 Tax=Corynespora cassiicola Philippines TaxID=1448308 RepID=A0A2T2N4Z5_CORCC|nr:GDPD-domain-containing protein [Corynespora cassiicola Philippines]
MKFRNRYSRHVVVAWDSHYVPYQHLKASLKATKRKGHEPSADFYVCFAQAIEANTTFSQQRHTVLQYDEDQLENQWSDTLTGHHSELAYLNFVSLQEALIELSLFYRVNYEAMNRIYAKLVRFRGPYNPELEKHRHNILAHFEDHKKAYMKCVKQLSRVETRIATFPNEKFAKRLDPHTLDRNLRLVNSILHKDNKSLIKRDGNSQNPLHLGATHGMVNFCMSVLSTASSVEEQILLRDEAGFTPLHLSVARGHVEVVQLLLSAIDKLSRSIPDELLHMALRREDDDMVRLLVSRSIGLQHKSCSGESCLYVAAQLGRNDYLRLLLPMLSAEYLEAAESACQWTPLFISCIEGHASTAMMLIDAGANTTRVDYLGWTAQENAAFRGYLTVAELFSAIDAAPEPCLSLSDEGLQREKASWFDFKLGQPHVILNLGSLQKTNLSEPPTLDLSGTLGHGLVLKISTSQSGGSIERMLPLFDDTVDDSYIFAVKDPAATMITFEIHKDGAERDEYSTLVGTGITYLHTQNVCLGSRYGTLLREQCVPILCRHTLRPMGTLTFSYLIAGPYHQLRCPLPSIASLEATSSVQLVGHRGLGQNSQEFFLQLGENTIESFLAARKQGARYVEVYVQITKDLIPVLFHDYSLSESGTDVPIHDVTFDQFMHSSNIQSPHGCSPSIVGNYKSSRAHDHYHLQRPRSRSVETTYEEGAKQVKNRMKHTVDYLKKGFKPNTRGDFIQDTFATLEEALCNVPDDIGFDMEIKYPRVHEALEAGFAPVSIDINIFVDTILDTITRFGGGRDIVLSSFTPDICILLAIKQKSYPVLFITNAGKHPISDKDKRASSLQIAARFAKQWGLAGIIAAADSLIMCPRLVNLIKSQGLICGTYNGLNNEPANVELQVRAGIDVIVADRVGLISKALKTIGPHR